MLLLVIFIFFAILEKIVLVDVILSWVRPFWERFRYNYIAPIVEPIYNVVRKILPTRAGMIDFAPLVVMLIVWVISRYLRYLPEIMNLVSI